MHGGLRVDILYRGADVVAVNNFGRYFAVEDFLEQCFFHMRRNRKNNFAAFNYKKIISRFGNAAW